MNAWKGIVGCRGYACAELRDASKASGGARGPAGTPEEEWARVCAARSAALQWLCAQVSTLRESGRGEEAEILDVQRIMLEDEDFAQQLQEAMVRAETAHGCVKAACAALKAVLKESGSPYLEERAADVSDAEAVMLRFLNQGGAVHAWEETDGEYIIFVDELLPSMVLDAKASVKGFAAAGGSRTAHACILARARNIPTLVGLGDGLKQLREGALAVLDGERGVLLTEPDAETVRRTREKIRAEGEESARLEQFRGKQTRTADGWVMKLYCNIASAAEAELALKADAEGVGLFRSEFLFFGRDCPPDEEEQAEAYGAVLRTMGGRETIIRTLDVGADKRVPGIAPDYEDNPALGCRGLRLCLAKPDIFRIQLRALARASVYGNLRILLPMVCTCEEVRRARGMLEEECAALHRSGVPTAENIPVGIMIETPAAALSSRELAKCADFFSIGTNDLTQYTMAADRTNSSVSRLCDASAQPVMALVRLAVRSARAARIPVGVCGESAADPKLALKYVKMGVTELSVAPSEILKLRSCLAASAVGRRGKGEER